MSRLTRVSRLESASNGGAGFLPYVWAWEGQSRTDALAAAGLPPDAPNPLLTWKPAQFRGSAQ